MTLDDAAPTATEAVAIRRDVPAAVDAEPIDAPADDRQQRRHQRHCCCDCDGHRQRTGDSEALQEVHTDQEQPEQRHDHRATGEHDCPAAGSHCGRDRVVHVAPGVELGAVASDHEQGVVDSDTESDHRRDGRREVCGRQEAGDERNHAQRQADTDQRTHDRKTHRDDRPEGDQQDDNCGRQADAFGGGNRAVDERFTAQRDLEVRRLVCCRDLFDGRRRVLHRWWAIAHERHGNERDAARADLFGMVDRAVDVIDARQRTNLVDDSRRRVDVVRLEHDCGGETTDRWHVRGCKVVGALRVRSVETIVDVDARGDHAAKDDDADQCGEPDDDRAVAVVN